MNRSETGTQHSHFGTSAANHRRFLTWVVRRWRGTQPLALGSPKPIERLNGKVESALREEDDSLVLMFEMHC